MPLNAVSMGAGEIGQALAKVVEKKDDVEIVLWDKDPTKTSLHAPLAERIPSADIVFLCIPSWTIREAVMGIREYLQRKTVVVSLAKGIEKESRKTMDELLEELLPPHQPLALLSGPMLSKELKAEKTGAGVVASHDPEAFTPLKTMFGGTNLLLDYSDDIHGVALSGVLKNIYALALGIAQGIGWGSNEKGWLVAASMKEMAEIVSLEGGRKETAFGLAGLGDLVATGFSPTSRNYRFGRELAETGTCSLESEGCIALPSFLERLGKKKDRFPLIRALERVIVEGADVHAIFENLIHETAA